MLATGPDVVVGPGKLIFSIQSKHVFHIMLCIHFQTSSQIKMRGNEYT